MKIRTRAGDDSGQAGGAEVLAFGLLIFVLGSLLVANVWGVIDAKMAVTAAAREATRAYLDAPTEVDAPARAESAAREAMRGHGRRGPVTVKRTGGLLRCAAVTFDVSYRVPAVPLPLIGGLDGGMFTVRARHSEVVGPSRGGGRGRGDDCAR